jgi:hypothetical protein
MLSKCLNPHCFKTFHYFGEGRLFRVDFSEAGRKRALEGKPVVTSIRSKSNPIEHFWLCEICSTTLTLEFGEAGEVHLVPLSSSELKNPEPRPIALPAPRTDKIRKAAFGRQA